MFKTKLDDHVDSLERVGLKTQVVYIMLTCKTDLRWLSSSSNLHKSSLPDLHLTQTLIMACTHVH